MKTSPLFLGAIVSTVLATASAFAADTKIVQLAEFGRDGAPRVTVVTRLPADSSHVQAFGRDVPATRSVTRDSQPFAVVAPTSNRSERYGRS
mgnify:CR=1 FL=1